MEKYKGLEKRHRGSEKRVHPRVKSNFMVGYCIKEKSGTYDLSQIKDISQGGMCLTTDRMIEKGKVLTLTMRFPFISQKIEFRGEAIYCKEIRKGLVYETRLKFLDLDEDFFKKLGKFIEKRLK